MTNPTFLFIQFMNSVSLAMNLYVVAVGLTMIFGVMRIVNFAHGAFYMVGAYVLFSVQRATGESDLGFWAGVLLAPVVMGVLAFAIERLLLSRLYDKDHLLQLLFTFALVLIFKDVVKLVWGAGQQSVSYPPALSTAVNLGLAYYPAYLLLVSLVGPIIAVGLWLTFEKTRWGRIINAARLDREMLSALGTDVRLVYAGVFVAGAMLAALGGALAGPRVAADPSMDGLVIIDCFIIVIIGGLGSLWGSFLGALCLSFIKIFGVLFFPEWEVVLVYLMLVLVLLVRPWGLLGQPDEERY